MLTARGEKSDTYLGRGLGTDDNLTKPFFPLDLVARVKTVPQRAMTAAASAGTA